MKTNHSCLFDSITGALVVLSAGCAGPNYTTSPYQPGPVVGHAIGAGAGAVVGNAAGAVVGAGEGIVGGIAAPFNTDTHLVRRWRTEVTPDGRTIQVPEDILVDSLGRPVNPPPSPANPQTPPPAPTTNFAPR